MGGTSCATTCAGSGWPSPSPSSARSRWRCCLRRSPARSRRRARGCCPTCARSSPRTCRSSTSSSTTTCASPTASPTPAPARSRCGRRTSGAVTNGIQEIRDANGTVVEEYLASQYEFHPAHNHWHLGDVALFEVRRGSPTGPVVGEQLEEGDLLPARLVPARRQLQHGVARVLGLRDRLPGHLPGWVDQYHHSLEGQRLDLTSAPNGVDLYLVSTANFDAASSARATSRTTRSGCASGSPRTPAATARSR